MGYEKSSSTMILQLLFLPPASFIAPLIPNAVP
jgi:hypothetical protein